METAKSVPFFNWIAVAICLCWLRNVNGKQDLTMQHKATGCEVAKAAIDKLEQLMEKSIELGYYFQTRDKYMLTRLAFLSEFGETEYRENASGIWQLTRENWEKAQTVVSGTSQVQIGRLIQQQLGFYFHDTTFENQTQPMVNLVAAQIMIEIQAIQSDVVPARIDKNGQWDFWKNATGLSDPDGSLQSSFNQKSDLLDTNSGDGGSECMICTDPPTDAVFIMDGSGSIDDDEYQQQKNFVKAVMNQFEDQMTVGESQVAFVLFSDILVESKEFSSNKQAADLYIERLGNPNGGTDLDMGLNEGIRIVRESVHSRLNDETVRKFIFFLTDGQGPLTDETVNNLRSLSEVVVYSIGMAGNVDPNALTRVASHENFVKIYATFDEFEADVASILYATCRITSFKVRANDTAYTLPSLMLSENRYVTLEYTDGTIMKVDMEALSASDEVIVYISCSAKYPNEANFDYKKTLTKPPTSVYISCPYDTDADSLNKRGLSRSRRSSQNGSSTVNGTNGTVTEITAAFVYVSTNNSCSGVCSTDVSMNFSTVDRSVIEELSLLAEDVIAEIVPEDGADWVILISVILGPVGILVLIFILAYIGVNRYMEIKDRNQKIATYNEEQLCEEEKYNGREVCSENFNVNFAFRADELEQHYPMWIVNQENLGW